MDGWMDVEPGRGGRPALQEMLNVCGRLGHQRDVDEDERLVDQRRVHERVDPPAEAEPRFELVHRSHRVHCLVPAPVQSSALSAVSPVCAVVNAADVRAWACECARGAGTV